MNKKVYIRGNDLYPEKVIETLIKCHPATNPLNLKGYNKNILYFINGNFIECCLDNSFLGELITSHLEWEEIFIQFDFKYKCGDLVRHRYFHDIFGKVARSMWHNGKPIYEIHDLEGFYKDTISEDLLIPYEFEALTWSDMVNNRCKISGNFIKMNSGIAEVESAYANIKNRNVFANEKFAKSAVAMAQISQLIMQSLYGGWVPLGEDAYEIFQVTDKEHDYKIQKSKYHGGILRFHTEEQANKFMESNPELVKNYLMWYE